MSLNVSLVALQIESVGRRRLLEAEQELRECWSVSKQDFVGVTREIDRLWNCLRSEKAGLINHYGALQDKGRALSDSRQMALDSVFESEREAIFETLRRPLTRLASGIRKFERHVDEAVRVLEQQCKAARLPRIQATYRAEQTRLKQRVEVLKRRAQDEGWL